MSPGVLVFTRSLSADLVSIPSAMDFPLFIPKFLDNLGKVDADGDGEGLAPYSRCNCAVEGRRLPLVLMLSAGLSVPAPCAEPFEEDELDFEAPEEDKWVQRPLVDEVETGADDIDVLIE